MKSKLILMAMAAFALASCSKDESTEINKGNAIDFRVAMQTRAEETTTANINEFYVTALDKGNANYFTDVKFEKEGDYFTSTPAYYWPGDDSEIKFFAYSPAKELLGNNLTINNSTKQLVDYEPNSSISQQVDFITVKATGKKSENSSTGVALVFQHRLSQIVIKAKNSNTGYTYKVTGVRIGKSISKGTFKFETEDWSTSVANKANYQVEYNETALTLNDAAQSIMGEGNGNAMLIPQQLVAWNPATDNKNTANGSYIAVKVQITTAGGARIYPVAEGVDYDWVAVPVDTNWEQGKKYVYTLDFSNGSGKVDPEKPTPTDPGKDPYNPGGEILDSGSAIKFTVTVSDWTSVDNDITL